jgi:purine-nucleoside phosphorylase
MNYEQAQEAAQFIKSKYKKEIKIAVVLGSGLGAFGEEVENAVRISYEEIPHFQKSTVEGHAGQLILGEVAGYFSRARVRAARHKKFNSHKRGGQRRHGL